jgi:hypothetical protein
VAAVTNKQRCHLPAQCFSQVKFCATSCQLVNRSGTDRGWQLNLRSPASWTDNRSAWRRLLDQENGSARLIHARTASQYPVHGLRPNAVIPEVWYPLLAFAHLSDSEVLYRYEGCEGYGSPSSRRTAARLFVEARVSGWSGPSTRWRAARVCSCNAMAPRKSPRVLRVSAR